MEKKKIIEIKVVSETNQIEVNDYRTPNRHYGFLKNQFVSPEEFSKVNSKLRQSLDDEYNTKLTSL